jgi:uncharacterized protein (TIGR03083 family)
MRVLEMIVDERRRAADLLAGLAPEQLRQPSLCAGWTVHDIAAHLLSYLHFGRARLFLGLLMTAADLDRTNVRLTRREAGRPSPEIIDLLRRRAGCRFSIPRSGHDPVLTDLLLHDLDMRLPLGILRVTPEERLRVAFDHITSEQPALGFTLGSRLRDLRLETTDTGWAAGTGAPVRGPAEAVLLAATGRTVAFDALDGDGVPLLRQRVTAPSRTTPARRTAQVIALLVSPPRPATPQAGR